MTTRKVWQNGVQIDGRWYWNKAIYGYCGRVICTEPAGSYVDIFTMSGQLICTATLITGQKI